MFETAPYFEALLVFIEILAGIRPSLVVAGQGSGLTDGDISFVAPWVLTSLCFSHQFWSSINPADYMALLLGFVTRNGGLKMKSKLLRGGQSNN
ncbi:hypothetical protein K1719_044187 [Acacia pycnantha]|nr:hypothetical protein K1719_044187 [Acacia pycnantha]